MTSSLRVASRYLYAHRVPLTRSCLTHWQYQWFLKWSPSTPIGWWRSRLWCFLEHSA